MNIIIKKKPLEDILQKLSGGISSKNMQILSFVLIDVLDKKVQLTVTDLEVTLSCERDAEVQEKGSICVPFKSFLSIVRCLADSGVELVSKDDKLWIRCEQCEYVLNGVPKQNFPKIPTVKEKQVVKVLSKDIKEMIEMTSFCSFVGESNYVLSGVLFEIEKNTVRLVATDGKRLAKAERKLSKDQAAVTGKISFILPLKAVNEVSKNLKDQEEALISFGKKQVDFDLGDVLLSSRVIEGEFPDYQKYIPVESTEKVNIEREEFLQALRRASILTTTEHKGIKLEIKKDRINISRKTPQLGEYKEKIKASHEGKELSMGFNPDYLIDVLKNSSSASVLFDVYGSDKPVVFREEGYLYLALPMRID